MKILVVSQYFWPEYFRVNDLVEELTNNGIEVEILTSYPNYPGGKVFKEFRDNPKKFKKFNNCKIYRVPQISRGKGTLSRLTFNYMSFLICSLFFSFFKLRKKNYDYVFTFATSPIIVALTSIFLCKFTKSKHILWVLDLWPNVLNDLNIFKENTFIYRLFEKIVKFIYSRTDIILCQSLTYKKKIRNISKSFIDKTVYFPSWPELPSKIKNSSSHDYKNEAISKKKFNLLFTGNIGDAQNFGLVLELVKVTKDRINWIVAGEGRRFSVLQNEKKIHSLDNLKLLGLLKFDDLQYYVNKSDALLISLKPGQSFDATIPGKFQTYLNYKKKIFGLIGGEVKDIINKYKIGFATNSQDISKLKTDLMRFLSDDLDKKEFENKINTLNKIFNKQRNMSKLVNYLSKIISFKKINLKFLNDPKKLFFKQNFVLSAFNLAFLGAYAKGQIEINKNFFIWPDGYYFKKISKLHIDKLPGREFLNQLTIPEEIKDIYILGNLSKSGKIYLEEKFKKKINHVQLPYGELNDFKKFIPIFKENEICFLTLPTPKQEIIANYIQKKQKFYKIFCFGAAINMACGFERPLPKYFEKFFFAETIWRLQFETKRRTLRLLQSFNNYLYGKRKGYFNNITFTNIHED